MQLHLLARIGEVRHLAAGEVVFREGDPGKEMFIVLSGRVRVQRRTRQGPVTIATLGPGSFFGEMSLLEKLARSATVVAEEPSDVIAIGEGRFLAALTAEPQLALRMMKVLSSRIRRLEEALLSGRPLEPSAPVLDAAGEAESAARPTDMAPAEDARPATPPGPDEAPATEPGEGASTAGSASAPPEAPDAVLAGYASREYLFEKRVQCPVCRYKFEAYNLRAGRLRMLSMDRDLRVRYDGFEPLWFQVWVCPGCRYANLRSDFEALDARARQALEAGRAERMRQKLRVNPGGGSPQTVGQAVDGVRLALMCAEAARLPAERVGRLWMCLSWMYADLNDPEASRQARLRALEKLEEAYAQSRKAEDDQRLAYLVGVLHYEAGDTRKAYEYLLRAIKRRGGLNWVNERASEVLAELRSAVQSASRDAAQGPPDETSLAAGEGPGP